MTILIPFRFIFKDDTKFYLTNDPRLKRECRENKPSMKSMGEINLNVPAKKNKCLNFFPFNVLHHVFYLLCKAKRSRLYFIKRINSTKLG